MELDTGAASVCDLEQLYGEIKHSVTAPLSLGDANLLD